MQRRMGVEFWEQRQRLRPPQSCRRESEIEDFIQDKVVARKAGRTMGGRTIGED